MSSSALASHFGSPHSARPASSVNVSVTAIWWMYGPMRRRWRPSSATATSW
jgi:hypothetical protein